MFSNDLGVKQRDLSDCGPACLSSVSSFYGKKCSTQKIRQWASTTRNGTNFIGMLDACKMLGFDAKAGKAKISFLENHHRPFIAMVKRGSLNHFVVIYKLKRRIAVVMDPSSGRVESIARGQFVKEWTGIVMFLQPAVDFEKTNTELHPLVRLFKLTAQYRTDLVRIFIYSLGYTSLGLTTSLYIKILVDQGLTFRNGDLINYLSTGMILVSLLMWALGWYKGLVGLKIGQLIDSRLNIGYYNHVIHLPAVFFDRMRTGEILSRIGDAFKIRSFIADSLSNLLVNLMIVVFSFLLMFIFSVKLALLSALIIPVYIIIYAVFNKLHRRMEYKVMEKWADVESHLVSSMESIATIRECGIESEVKIKHEINFIEFLGRLYSSGYYSLISTNLSETITRVFTIIILWVGAYEILVEQLTVGELLSFYALIGYFKFPLQNLMGVNKVYQSAVVATERLMELESPKESPSFGPLMLEVPPSINFKEVTFKYGSSKPLLMDFNLEVASGKLTVIVGKSGSGKSTLLSLIRKKYVPQHGSISVGNYPLNLWSEEKLIQNLGIAPQHPTLLPGRLIENICLGQKIEVERVMALIAEYELEEFFHSFPESVNTYAGEGGVELSGGEKQVISLLRLIYKNPEVVLMDEPTSMMDPFTAKFFTDVLTKLRSRNRTILLVTHHLKISLLADFIVVMEKGKILEEGIPARLLQTDSWFSKSCQEQGLLETNSNLNGNF